MNSRFGSRAVETTRQSNDKLILGILAGMVISMFIGGIDHVLGIAWWQVIGLTGGSIFGMYGVGLLFAWGVNADKGQGAGLTLVPGAVGIILLFLAIFIALMQTFKDVPQTSQLACVVFLVTIWVSAIIVFVKTIQSHIH